MIEYSDGDKEEMYGSLALSQECMQCVYRDYDELKVLLDCNALWHVGRIIKACKSKECMYMLKL